MTEHDEGSHDVPSPALDTLLGTALAPLADPELNFAVLNGPAGPIAASVELRAEASSLVVSSSDGQTLALDHTDLDQTVQELAGSQPGLQAAHPDAGSPWDAQTVLRGTTGNDHFVWSAPVDAAAGVTALSIEATPGSDFYQGSTAIERVVYSRLAGDSLSGLYISDRAENLPLISNNLPPLIAQAFANDGLLVYKQYSNSSVESVAQVDVLREIDILSLGSGTDSLQLASEHPSLIVDFGAGIDTASVRSAAAQPDVSRFLGLETLNWMPTDASGQALVASPIAFSVLEWNEDATTLLPLGTYPPEGAPGSQEPWQLTPFALPGQSVGELPDWLQLRQLAPTPELVGVGRLVISRQLVVDSQDASLLWLELSVHDQRPGGLGLVGLEIDLSWNAAALELDPTHLNTDEVFIAEQLPLFRSLGRQATTASREQLIGLAAAALPQAGQGVALGLPQEQGGQTLFARLAFRRQNPEAPIDLHLTPTLTPAAAGVTLAASDLLVLDDTSAPVWVIQATPDQQDVGSHAFTLSRGSGAEAEVRHFAVAVREVNDAPKAVAVNPVDLQTTLNQGAVLNRELRGLFSDQDDAALVYGLPNPPAWLQINSSTGVLSGTPGNAEVGEHTITVQAADGRGGVASQTLRISVLNVNDRPEIGAVALEPPSLIQGQSFTFRIPTGAFRDPDQLVDPKETLTYSLVPEAGATPLPSWIHFDAASATLSGTPGPGDVGECRFRVRATDAAGLFVEQAVVIKVANVNDAPGRTAALKAFLDNPIALFSGLEHSIDLKPWFSDPDLGVDPNELLTLAVQFEAESGALIDLTDVTARPPWLHWDPQGGLLTLNPTATDVGEHTLRVSATDRAGLIASALLPLLVRHRNTAPVVQFNRVEDLLAASRLEGVLATTPQQSGGQLTGLQLALAEDSSFRIELPASLFGDDDLSVDLAERLTYSAPGLPTGFTLDTSNPSSLIINGSTAGLALEAPGGRASWTAQLTVDDAAGERASFDLQLVLQRSAAQPVLTARRDPAAARWDEGSAVPLAELLSVDLPNRPGEQLELLLERQDGGTQILQLLDDKRQPIAARAEGGWLLRGFTGELQAQLKQLTLAVDRDPHAIGSFALRVTANTTLGSTGLRSAAVSAEVGFSLEPVATAPIWSTASSTGAVDPLALSVFADHLTAALADPREQLLAYAVELPATAQGLVITNRAGTVIGDREGHMVWLSPGQWAEAMLRSDGTIAQPVELAVRAFSAEPSTDLQAASAIHRLSWVPTPLLQDVPKALAIIPEGVQRAGGSSTLTLELAWPALARSGQLQLDLPQGSDASLQGYTAQRSVVNGQQRLMFKLQPEALQLLPRELHLAVINPESLSGTFEGRMELISSVRADLQDADRANGLATVLDQPIVFHWDVAQVANTPEFAPPVDLRFDPATGALQIDLRRGSSGSGFRNPAEALILSVSDIPPGYVLAERVDGAFRAVGATDAFGTMTLFSLPAVASGSTQALDAYQRLNNGNLYLVSRDGVSSPLSGTEKLTLALTAQISDQPGGDSRSVAARHKITLAPFTGPAPLLSPTGLSIDPIVLDLSGHGLNLTSLAQGANFAMLPQAPALPTAWLSAAANVSGQRSAAFLVMNDSRNDSSIADVSIRSITELLSEYFQAEGRLRSFATGSAALASLNRNADLVLDAADPAWSQLQLWFDDGDAISETGELVPIDMVLRSIDLGSLNTLITQPSWAAGNAVLRSLSGARLENSANPYSLYDIGLQVDLRPVAAGERPALLPLSTNGPLSLLENGEPIVLQLESSGSEAWSSDGRDALTLVRLIGLPEQLVPALGVKDSRGDWLFTWADLKNANGGQLELFSHPNWSGNANLQVLISQLQADGTLLSSALTSLALDVVAVADAPLLRLNAASIQEDTPLALSALLVSAALTDTDGSETLSYELSGLPAGAFIQRVNNGVISVLQPSEDRVYRIAPADLAGLAIVPPANQSGPLSFFWRAVAREQSNGATNVTTATVQITVRGVADAPLAPVVAPSPPALVEGQSVALGDLIVQPNANAGLADTDGSEQLRLEFTLPSGLRLQKTGQATWLPISSQTQADGSRVVTIAAADLSALRLVDRGVRQGSVLPESLQLSVTRISREVDSGDQARSAAVLFNLAIDRNARPAVLTIPAAPVAMEDSTGIALSDLVQAAPAQQGDQLSYRIAGLAEGVRLVNAQGTVQPVAPAGFTLNSLQGWRLQAEPNLSGQFTVDLRVISTPPGQGARAESPLQQLAFSITPVADIPALALSPPLTAPLTIDSNGWLNLGTLQPQLSSPDRDGSERLSVVIGALNAAGVVSALPAQTQFNAPARQLDDGRWEVQQIDLAGLKLYVGEIANDLHLVITPQAREGSSTAIGAATTVLVGANAVVRVPLLEVQGVLQGFEDQPIPLLSQLQGVINARLRGSGTGQTLELELYGLPHGSVLKRGQDSVALNRDSDGQLLTSLRLPYAQWQNVFWQGPPDASGSFAFQVKAYSVGANQTLSSEASTVQVLLTPVNDAPKPVTLQDLAPAQEGVSASWDLRSRFIDVDSTDLRIDARQLTASGEAAPLPSWLSLAASGVLSGTPTNADVGVLRLEITATDPLGQRISQQVGLSVGDTNATPVFNSQPLQGWTSQSQNGTTTYLRSLDLRQSVQIDLSAVFSDEDVVNNDQLSYSISQDGIMWSQQISGLAVINSGVLTIHPQSKAQVGEQTIQLRATDMHSSSNVQRLQVTVRNVNDAPIVTRKQAMLLRTGVWQEVVQLSQGQSNWELNLEGLFGDADPGELLEQIDPSDLPAWLSYTPSTTGTGGVLRGTPSNRDVGSQILEWRVSDRANAGAQYQLRLDVLNTNDAPGLKSNPNLSQLGAVVNGVPTLDQGAYGQLDLSDLFEDPDSPYGDALRYSIASVVKDGQPIQSIPNWLAISSRTTETPDATGKLLLEPVLYRIASDGSTGARLQPNELSQLEAGTTVRVVVQATDNRGNVPQKGLVGVDLDVSWSSALSFITGSAEINPTLPLFREITTASTSLRVQAGAAPDLRIGSPVGDQAREALLRFDVRVNEPAQRIVINLSPGEGLNRDGLTGGQAETFDTSNSLIHSFASNNKTFFEALRPGNDEVGTYQITLVAEDQAGAKVSKTLTTTVGNINDAPQIDRTRSEQITDLLSWLSQERREGAALSSKSLSMFTDPDLRFGDKLSYQLVPGAADRETNAWVLPDSIILRQASDSSVVLDLIPPRSLTEVIAQQFKLVATDARGLSTSSDWFTVAFTPLAEATLLTRGVTAQPLKSVQLGDSAPKNTTLDLQSVLDLNALSLADPEGDEVVFKVLVKDGQAQLSLANSTATDFFSRTEVNGDVLFSIELDALTHISGRPAGNLEGLQLTLSPNQFELVPQALSSLLKAGIPLQVWTETRVKGDANARFDLATTKPATLWIPFENARPDYESPGITRLDAGFFAADQFSPGQALIRLADHFTDTDPSDVLNWELVVPKALEGLVELNADTGEIRLASRVATLANLPAGSHRLIVRARDSSGQIGDSSGIASGSIRVLVVPASESSAAVTGLSLLTQLDTASLNTIFDKSPADRTEAEKQVITILQKLNVKETERGSFMQKLEQGSLAVLSNPDVNRPMIVIDSSRMPGALLMDAVVDEAKVEVLSASRQLLEGREIINTPLGQVEFAVDTQGRDFSVVQLQMPKEGVSMDTLFKTDALGQPRVFHSQLRTYSEANDGPLDQWLASLQFGLYYYDPTDNRSLSQSPILSISASNSELSAALLAANPIFNLSQVGKIDGSAYMIDLDGNNTIDLVSMLLVDQGWFDTRKDVLGLIGDPLMPAATAVLPGDGNNGASADNPAGQSSSIRPQIPQHSESPQTPFSETRAVTPKSRSIESSNTRNFSVPAPIDAQATLQLSTGAGGIAKEGPSQGQGVVDDVEAGSSALHNQKHDPANKGFLDSAQRWMQDRRQDLADAARSILSPLQAPNETSIAMAMAMLALPILMERSVSAATRRMDRDLNLKLPRRDVNYSGCWIFATRQGFSIIIRRDQGKLSILRQHDDRINPNHLTALPGFDGNGQSLLSQAMPLAKSPGKFVAALNKLITDLQKNDYPEMNWIAWLDTYFRSTAHRELPSSVAVRSFNELQQLMKKAMELEAALADVVMLSQLYDCALALELSSAIPIATNTIESSPSSR